MIARIGLSDPSDPIRDEAGINNGWIKVIRLEAGYPMVELAVHHNVTQTKKNHTKSTKMLSFPSESIILIWLNLKISSLQSISAASAYFFFYLPGSMTGRLITLSLLQYCLINLPQIFSLWRKRSGFAWKWSGKRKEHLKENKRLKKTSVFVLDFNLLLHKMVARTDQY